MAHRRLPAFLQIAIILFGGQGKYRRNLQSPIPFILILMMV